MVYATSTTFLTGAVFPVIDKDLKPFSPSLWNRDEFVQQIRCVLQIKQQCSSIPFFSPGRAVRIHIEPYPFHLISSLFTTFKSSCTAAYNVKCSCQLFNGMCRLIHAPTFGTSLCQHKEVVQIWKRHYCTSTFSLSLVLLLTSRVLYNVLQLLADISSAIFSHYTTLVTMNITLLLTVRYPSSCVLPFQVWNFSSSDIYLVWTNMAFSTPHSHSCKLVSVTASLETTFDSCNFNSSLPLQWPQNLPSDL